MRLSVAIRRIMRRLATPCALAFFPLASCPRIGALAGETKPKEAALDDASRIEFFEKSVRPVLATRCQSCHGATKQKGGLRLDSRSAALAGGNTGPAVVPGDAGASLLIQAVNYGEDVRMPP